jgi:hypothetical protein
LRADGGRGREHAVLGASRIRGKREKQCGEHSAGSGHEPSLPV